MNLTGSETFFKNQGRKTPSGDGMASKLHPDFSPTFPRAESMKFGPKFEVPGHESAPGPRKNGRVFL